MGIGLGLALAGAYVAYGYPYGYGYGSPYYAYSDYDDGGCYLVRQRVWTRPLTAWTPRPRRYDMPSKTPPPVPRRMMLKKSRSLTGPV